MTEQAAFPVLLVEDNPGDVELVRQSLRPEGIELRLSVVRSGEEALEFLHRQPPYEAAPRPRLVLLDLNLPRKGGLQILDEIKVDPDLRRIPVVILTSSQSPHDVARCYDHHASSYVSKPIDLDEFSTAMRSLERFWFGTAELPI